MDFSKLSDKSLVAYYVFHYPIENKEEQKMLGQELSKRELLHTAGQIFSKIYDYFTEIWIREGKK